MLGQVLVNAIFCAGQLLAVVFCLVALFTNQWIRGVNSEDEDDKYFQRVDALQDEYFLTGGQDDTYSSAGLFRLWASGDTSYPLPIVDTELKFCKAGLTVSSMIGALCLFTSSFQVFKLFSGNLALEMLIGWAVVFQTIMTLSGVAVGMNYFRNTFSYDSSGISLFSGWIAFVIELMLVANCVFKVLIAKKTHEEQKEKMKKEQEATLYKQPQAMYEKYGTPRKLQEPQSVTLRSASSDRLQQPAPASTSRPGTASRPGTMQSQQRYETGGRYEGDHPMRRALSQDSKQFDSRQQSPPSRSERNDFMHYDQGDLPRHIR